MEAILSEYQKLGTLGQQISFKNCTSREVYRKHFHQLRKNPGFFNVQENELDIFVQNLKNGLETCVEWFCQLGRVKRRRFTLNDVTVQMK